MLSGTVLRISAAGVTVCVLPRGGSYGLRLRQTEGCAFALDPNGDGFGIGAPAGCPGDCNGDGHARVNELILGAHIALGELAVSTCTSLDRDDNQIIDIAELVGGVRSLIEGCG